MSARLKPIGDVRTGCLNCRPRSGRLNLNGYHHPGFGVLWVTRDGEPMLYDVHGDIPRPAMRAENMARKDPDHDWRFVVEGPLGGVAYQRHGRATWHAVERLRGFA